MTMGMAAVLPHVFAMAALKVAMSPFVVLLVSPGTMEPAQSRTVDHSPLPPPPVQDELAARADR